MGTLIAFGTGLLFGLGLIVSGMADPAKVVGFLDVAGPWDPSLACVMVGAITVACFAFTHARRHGRTWQGQTIHLPTNRRIDPRLAVGATIFGIGWGLAGICPGPALVLTGAGMAKGVIFTAAMLSGMLVFAGVSRQR